MGVLAGTIFTHHIFHKKTCNTVPYLIDACCQKSVAKSEWGQKWGKNGVYDIWEFKHSAHYE